MHVLWVASGNPKKRAELERLLGPLGYALRLQSELDDPPQVVEDAPDFAGNAALKARALARAVDAMAVGDDSGLCVDALGGRPGVLSARYAGEDASDHDRIEKLLGELGSVAEPERGAHFVCHICLADAAGEILARFEERCDGRIASQPVGDGGFGYDPVFVPDALPDTTFARLGPEAKDRVSHRGKALRKLVDHLRQRPARG